MRFSELATLIKVGTVKPTQRSLGEARMIGGARNSKFAGTAVTSHGLVMLSCTRRCFHVGPEAVTHGLAAALAVDQDVDQDAEDGHHGRAPFCCYVLESGGCRF